MRRWWVLAMLAGGGCDDGGEAGGADVAVSADATSAQDAGAPDAGAGDAGGPVADQGASIEDVELAAADFDCMLEWTKVRRFYITNKRGRLEEALDVANNPAGGTYPPGTVIQLVPQEAMVKRAPGWNPVTNDWEFFFLNIDGDGQVTIGARGAEDTVNAFGGNCFECHNKAAPQWDLICEQDHGCDPLPLSARVIENLQQADARCR
ncbi:MAG: hypothetical protein KC613_18110 [Myxococcales bacterium]|nr:hypothetical protein [Myxococcales bacterium]